jgi:hypothetical protein
VNSGVRRPKAGWSGPSYLLFKMSSGVGPTFY